MKTQKDLIKEKMQSILDNHNLKDDDGHTADDEWKMLKAIQRFAEVEKTKIIRKAKIKKIDNNEENS